MRAMLDHEPFTSTKSPYPIGAVVRYIDSSPRWYSFSSDPVVFVDIGSEGVVTKVGVSSNEVIFYLKDEDRWKSQVVHPIRLARVM